MPFNNLNHTEYNTFFKFDVIETQNNSNIKLNPTAAQQKIIDKLNALLEQNNYNNRLDSNEKEDDYSGQPDNQFDQPITCSYFSCDEFVDAKFEAHKNFSVIHLNIHSIQLHIEELRVLLHALNYKFDIIAISESKLKCEPHTNISLSGYHPPYCKFTEAEKCQNYDDYTLLWELFIYYFMHYDLVWFLICDL